MNEEFQDSAIAPPCRSLLYQIVEAAHGRADVENRTQDEYNLLVEAIHAIDNPATGAIYPGNFDADEALCNHLLVRILALHLHMGRPPECEDRAPTGKTTLWQRLCRHFTAFEWTHLTDGKLDGAKFHIYHDARAATDYWALPVEKILYSARNSKRTEAAYCFPPDRQPEYDEPTFIAEYFRRWLELFDNPAEEETEE